MPELALEKRNATLGFRLRNEVEIEIYGSGIFRPEYVDLLEHLRFHHLLLPGDGDGPGAELLQPAL